MGKKVLIIIDAQNDFINGSLAVKGAETQMKSLVKHLLENGSSYSSIITTMDSHPPKHVSFVDNGGIWPSHCVMNTEGWKLYSEIYDAITALGSQGVQSNVVYKGLSPDKEEYSAVDDEYNMSVINTICEDADEIDICGIMSEYCVYETVKGLCNAQTNNPYNNRINLLWDYIATADNHVKLKQLAEEKGIMSQNFSE